MDRLETMRVFVAVSDARGFAAAARKLAMSPPAVTRAIAALEDRLGAQLLRRTTRVVKLTDAGVRFLADCRRILADVDDAEASASGSQQALRGSLAVTASVMFGQMFVAPILLDYLALHPQVKARALLSDRIVDLLEEEIDIAVRIAHLPPQSLEIAVRVGSVRRVVCGSPTYFAARGTPKTPRDLERLDAIVFSHTAMPAQWSFVSDSKIQSVRPSAQLVVNSTELSIAATMAGRGVTMALSYQVADAIRAGHLVAVLETFEPPPVPIHVVHREGRHLSARIRAFVDLAVQRLRANSSLKYTAKI